MPNTPKIDHKKWAILIFGVAFIIRLVYLLQIKSNPFFNTPMVDELWNIQWAEDILSKSFWGTQIYFRGPLYPYLLALFLKITGSSYFWTRLIQMVISSATVSVTYLLGRRFFSERVARLGSIFLAIYGTIILYDAMFLIPVIFVFLNMLGLYLLARHRDNPGLPAYFVIGIIFGLSAIARPNILFVVPFLAIWIFVRFRRRIETRSNIILVLLFLIGVGLPIAPVTIRNYVVADDFVLISSQGGINLYLGNNTSAEGMTMLMPEIDLDASVPWTKFIPVTTEYAEKQVGHPLKPSQASAFWADKAKTFIFEHPGQFLALTFKKLVYFFSGFENPDQHDIYDFRKYSSLLSVLVFDYGLKFPYGLFAPLGLFGIGLCYRKRREMAPLLIFFFGYIPTVVLFLVTARHRLTIIPVMLLFAAYAIFYFYDKIKAGKINREAVPLVILVVLLILSNHNFFELGLQNSAQIHQNLALTYSRQEKYPEAINEYKLAIAEAPRVSALYFGLGTTYLNMERYDDAIQQLKTAVSIDPNYYDAFINLGASYEKTGDVARAEMNYRRAATLEPDNKQPYAHLGELYMSQEKLQQAAQNFQRVVQIDTTDYITLAKLGVLHGRVGDTATAFSYFRRALSINPGYAAGYLNWGNIELVNGDTSVAIDKYNEAKGLDRTLVEPYFNLAVLYMRLGDRDKALSNLDSLLIINPNYERARELKRQLEN
jgi:tetratricopeptide (TPR) repeat protein